MSTSTSSAASTAAPRLSATTTAIASPWKRTMSRASVGRSMSSGAIGPGGKGARSRSAPVNTPATPGAAAAASVSMLRMRPWATSERTKCAWSAPGASTSSV